MESTYADYATWLADVFFQWQWWMSNGERIVISRTYRCIRHRPTSSPRAPQLFGMVPADSSPGPGFPDSSPGPGVPDSSPDPGVHLPQEPWFPFLLKPHMQLCLLYHGSHRYLNSLKEEHGQDNIPVHHGHSKGLCSWGRWLLPNGWWSCQFQIHFLGGKVVPEGG